MKHLMLTGLLLLAPALLAQTAMSSNFQPAASSPAAGAVDAPLFEFELTTISTLNFTALTFTDNGTRVAGDFVQYSLYYVNTSGGGSLVLLDTVASPGTSFSGFTQSIPGSSPQGFVIAADISGTATNGNTFQITLANGDVTMSVGGVTGGPISGNTHTISNTGTPPVMSVEDSLGTTITSGVGITYDLAAAQGDTQLGGQTYTFTVLNTGTGPLNFTNTAPDYVQTALESNVVVTPVQPSSGSVAAGSTITFGLQIVPQSAAAFSFRLVIQNNSATNPYTFNITGNGVVLTATQLVVVTQPAGAAPGVAFATQPVVQVQDASGIVITSDNTTQVTVSITPATGASGAVLSGTATVTAVNGVVTFSGLSIDLAGTGYTLDFDDGGALTDATSSAFNVSAGGGGGSGGGGGGDSGGCTAQDSDWLPLTGVLGLIAVALRRRRTAR
ncbi:MAG: hypothetical protein KDB90_16285 [Planctomycetes bacterium]|nr:hypothetical protein [Planctomycetota bacterium]